MEVLGREPQPRLIVIGVDSESADGRAIAALVRTARFLGGEHELHSLRQRDWDCALLWNSDAPINSELFLLRFGGSFGDSFTLLDQRAKIRADGWSYSRELVIPEGVDDELALLIKTDLVPKIHGAGQVSVLRVSRESSANGRLPQLSDVPHYSPLLVDGDGRCVAVRYTRPGGAARGWWLPLSTSDPAAWLKAALAEWRVFSPERFPHTSENWNRRAEWMTQDEVIAECHEADLCSARASALAEFDSKISEAQRARDELRLRVDASERRLLTAQGDELVEAVESAFTELGFTVTNVDVDLAVRGDHREDLRIQDPTAVGWIALCEVRGYKRGAQLNDLLRLGRFVTRYVADEGTMPSRVWLVVNSFIGTDPGSRPRPLESNPVEMDTFGSDDGAVIDSKDLFLLLQAVRSGTVSTQVARESLRSHTGLWTLA